MDLRKYIDIAIEEAFKGTDYRIKVGCVIFDKGKVISKGHNCRRNHRKLHPNFYNWKGEIHAEMNAIINARTDLKGCTLLVIRVNKNRQLRLSKPCKLCLRYIEHVGIKKIYYSTEMTNIDYSFMGECIL